MSVADVIVIGYTGPPVPNPSDPSLGAAPAERMQTFQDIVDLILQSFDLAVDSRHHNLARRAVIAAYRDLPRKAQWKFLKRNMKIITQMPLAGSFADFSVGSGVVLFKDLVGTLPDDARDWGLILGDDLFEVIDRVSDTEVRLSPLNNPQQDVTDTGWTLYKSQYVLPSNFSRLDTHIVEIANAFELTYVETNWGLNFMRGNYQPQRPIKYTIRSDGKRVGRLTLELFPPPANRRTYDAIVEVKPRPLKTYAYSTGTVTIASGSDQLTFSGADMKAVYEGAIIRLGTEDELPEGDYGNIMQGVESLYEGVLYDVDTTADTAKVRLAPTDSFNDVRYTISDPIDIWPVATQSYFESLCMVEFVSKTNRRDLAEKQAESVQLLREAMGADRAVRHSMGAGSGIAWYDLDDWANADPYATSFPNQGPV